MKRTKMTTGTVKRRKLYRSQSKADMDFLSTVYALSNHIPAFSFLMKYYHDYYTEGYAASGGGLPDEVVEEIMQRIHDRLDRIGEEQTTIALLKLKYENFSCFYALHKLVDNQYKSYFLFVEGLPAQMARPFIWTSVASRKEGAFITSKGLVVGETGNEIVTIKGIIPYGRDFQLLHALVDLLNKKGKARELAYTKDPCIRFTTSRLEICTEMRCSNPSDKKQQKAVDDGLERLRSCTITWRNKKDGRAVLISGILSEKKEARDGEVIIYLHVAFLRLYQKGHINVDPELFYSLRGDRVIQLYCFLKMQKDYIDKGKWSGWGHDSAGADIFDVYRLAHLGNWKKKSESQQRYELKQTLEKLMIAGAVRKYTIRDDKLIVWGIEKDKPTQIEDPPVKMLAERNQAEQENPLHNRRYDDGEVQKVQEQQPVPVRRMKRVMGKDGRFVSVEMTEQEIQQRRKRNTIFYTP